MISKQHFFKRIGPGKNQITFIFLHLKHIVTLKQQPCYPHQ